MNLGGDCGVIWHYDGVCVTWLHACDPHADPNATSLYVANGGGLRPARNVIGGDFLHLVRLGTRAADNPLVRDSIAVVDRLLKVELPNGPSSLVRSVHDGVCFDRVEPAFQRYVAKPVKITHEMWSTRHPILRMPKGRVLRLILEADATILSSANDWANTIETDATHISALSLWFADLSTQDYPEGTVIKFRFHHKDPQPSEGINYSVSVGESR